jgi:hypothetical protein
MPTVVEITPQAIVGAHGGEVHVAVENLLQYLQGVDPDIDVQWRADDACIFVHPARMNAGKNKNIATIWICSDHIKIDIRPRLPGVYAPERYEAADPSFHDRIQQRYLFLAGLP